MIKLSFLIPVKEQSELLKKCIASIVPYKGSDIEIIVSDNCSEEDLKGIVLSFHDKRIHYFRNKENLGHDGNILCGFERAAAKHVFLLRTKDCMIAESIPYVIRTLDKYPDIGYLTGTALDPEGNVRIQYKRNELLRKGNEALKIHRSLYVHPSGSVYNKELLDIRQLRSFINSSMDSDISFLAHDLIRMELAVKSDFYLMKIPVWVYEYTVKSKEKSVLVPQNKEYVYSPRLVFLRMSAQMRWAFLKMNRFQMIDECIRVFKIAYDTSCWEYYIANKYPERGAYHYGIIPKEVNINKIQKQFLIKMRKIEKELCLRQSVKYIIQKLLFIIKINTYDKAKVKLYYRLLFSSNRFYDFRMLIHEIQKSIKKKFRNRNEIWQNEEKIN